MLELTVFPMCTGKKRLGKKQNKTKKDYCSFAALQSTDCLKNDGVSGFSEGLCQSFSAKSHRKMNVHSKRGFIEMAR